MRRINLTRLYMAMAFGSVLVGIAVPIAAIKVAASILAITCMGAALLTTTGGHD